MRRCWAVARSGVEVMAMQSGGASGRGGGQWRWRRAWPALLLGPVREPRLGSAHDEVGKGVRWRRGEDGVSRTAQVGRLGVAGVGLGALAPSSARVQRVGEKGGGGRRKKGKEGEKRKEKRKKRKRKRKREKEKWRERERKRAVGGIRGGGRPRARSGIRPVSDEHAK